MDTSYVVPSERYAPALLLRKTEHEETPRFARGRRGASDPASSLMRGGVFEMVDAICISATMSTTPKVLSKNRTDFGVEASNQSTHFCGIIKQQSNTTQYH